jgi:hypothetical protein
MIKQKNYKYEKIMFTLNINLGYNQNLITPERAANFFWAANNWQILCLGASSIKI